MQLKDYIPKIDKKIGETFFSGFTFDSSKVKKDNIFLINIMDLIINDLIKKTAFYIEHQKYIDYTLDKEKKLIQKILNNKNTNQILDLQSQINKNMHLANVLNLNKSDILSASLKELSSI